MRHDDELRLAGKFLEYAHEAVDVGVVERGIDLVEDAERAGLDRLTGNIKDVKVSEVAGYLVAQFRHVSNKQGKWFEAA